jgi:hypothetical protein
LRGKLYFSNLEKMNTILLPQFITERAIALIPISPLPSGVYPEKTNWRDSVCVNKCWGEGRVSLDSDGKVCSALKRTAFLERTDTTLGSASVQKYEFPH